MDIQSPSTASAVDRSLTQLLAAAAEATGDVYYILQLEPTFGFEFISASVEDHTGYTADEVLADPTLMGRALDSGDSEKFAATLATPIGSDVRVELRWVSATGEPVWTEHRAKKRQRADGSIVMEGSSRDISELRLAQESAEKAEAMYRSLGESAEVDRARLRATMDSLIDPHALVEAVRDTDGTIVDFEFIDANRAAWAENGLSRGTFIGQRMLAARPGMASSGLLSLFARVVDDGEPLILDNMTYDQGRPAHDQHFYDLRAVKVGDGMSITWRDVTDRQTVAQQLAYRAAHDGLTGLLNREALTERLGKALAGHPRTGEHLAVLFCDVDNLRAVNDQQGHLAGDALLKAVSDALLSSVRSGDLVGRFGGDEFIVVLAGVHGIEDAERVASGILAAASTPYSFSGVRFTPSLSVGLTLAQPGQVLDAIIRDADKALYAAKAGGRNRLVTFGPELSTG